MFIKVFIERVKRVWYYLPILRKLIDFDYWSVLELERAQLIRLRDSIIHYQNHENWKRDVDHIQTAINLIDIIEDLRLEAPYVNIKNAKRFGISAEYHDKEFYYRIIRVEKAWHLYHLLREVHMREWWD